MQKSKAQKTWIPFIKTGLYIYRSVLKPPFESAHVLFFVVLLTRSFQKSINRNFCNKNFCTNFEANPFG